jgi:TetR/AcrR family transcriptional regulator, regulator of biofilm formation and stress response
MPYVEASVRSRQFVAAARRVMTRDGVASASLRAVAAESDVPLGTLQYVFPSKERLLRAVIEDVVDEIARLLSESVDVERGLAHAIRQGLTAVWTQLVTESVDL